MSSGTPPTRLAAVAQQPGAASRRRLPAPAVLVVYLAALYQGFVLVSFPALSTVLTRGFGMSEAQYGAIFLPQLACAVAGAFFGGGLARRIGLKGLLAIALAAHALSQALLALLPVLPEGGVYPVVLAATATLGFGFGVSGAPNNSLPPSLFPHRAHSALVAAHMLVGLGLALGPLPAAAAVASAVWYAYPAALAVAGAALTLATLATRVPPGDARRRAAALAEPPQPARTRAFWMFVAATMFYALAEGTLANWAVIFLREARGLPEGTASLALSAFWGALVVGRLVVSALLLRIAPGAIWAALPLFVAAACLLLPGVSSASTGIALFGLAGLGCSAYLPLTIALASARFPEHVPWVAAMLIATLMVGVGLGSFAFGALLEVLGFDLLYPLSAIYPAGMLLVAVAILRSRTGRVAGPARPPGRSG